MFDLFPTTEHDPGAKPLAMLPGMKGTAEFYGANDEHRLTLMRWWGEVGGPYALSIGMNPSAARHDVDDRTIRKDIKFAQRLGMAGLYKVNVMSYRVTMPERLLEPGVTPTVPKNLEAILWMAKGAKIIIVACGDLPKPLRHHADTAFAALEKAGHEMNCFAVNASGYPKHSLFVRGDAPLIPYRTSLIGSKKSSRTH